MTGQLKLSGVLAAAGLLWALSVMPALADSTTLKVGVNKNMNAHLMTPDGPGPYPAILVLHTSGGLQSGDLEFAKRLAQEGYVALVPAFLEAYGIQAKTRQESFTTHAQSIYADFVASLDLLRRSAKVDGKKLGAIGFSNGGYFALWLAATGQVQAGVSYYGALSGAGTDRSLSRFRQAFTNSSAPVLVLHGTNDSTVPVRSAIELDSILTAAQSPHEFHQYPDAEHRFDRDRGAGNETAAADAWWRTQAFL
ncbi:MAG: dienelactone hydrolase family protein, partial [Sulfuricaulis sp.]|nr:dienelactone hydrolase family protein [Sulfuricaulis sp.]